MKRKMKWAFLVFGYVLYFISCLSFFRAGAMVLFPLAFFFQTALSVANFLVSKDRKVLISLDTALGVLTALTLSLDISLYTHYVSNDSVSYAIGEVTVIAGVLYVFFLSFVLFMIRIVSLKSKREKKMNDGI